MVGIAAVALVTIAGAIVVAIAVIVPVAVARMENTGIRLSAHAGRAIGVTYRRSLSRSILG
jgi:hypothetical protein